MTGKQIALSPSSISLFQECPRCFWLHKVKGIRRPDSIFPSLPSGMDRILKEHFDRFMDLGELPPEIRSQCAGMTLFPDKEKLEVWRNNRKGLQYTDKDSGMMLRGAVDNILQKDSKLIVLDYKTRGFPLKENTHKTYQTQLDLYSFLLQENGYATEDYGFLLFYYPSTVLKTGEVVFDTKLVKMKTSTKEGEKVFKAAIKVLQGKEPRADEDCGFCRYRGER